MHFVSWLHQTAPPLCLGMHPAAASSLFFFFNDTATTEIYTLSLHDALPISVGSSQSSPSSRSARWRAPTARPRRHRSEAHTSELQSRPHLVCRLLLEKKKDPLISTPLLQPTPLGRTPRPTDRHSRPPATPPR